MDGHVLRMCLLLNVHVYTYVGMCWAGAYSVDVCMSMCKQTELWLTLQLITQHSQLLITQHLFCPHSTLFCIHCQPGSLHRIKQRALSNTLLLKRCSSAVLSLVQCYSGDTSAHIFSVLRTQQMVRNVSPLIALISLWG